MSGDPAEPGGPKADPEALTLRARPRPVARFNRRVVIGIAIGVSAVLFAATWLALNPPDLTRRRTGGELYSLDRKPTAEGLAALPKGYGELAPKPAPPKLGPPMAGDLGPPVAHLERDLGVTPPPASGFSIRPNPEDDAARAERLRLARQAQQAREAGLFFQVAARQGGQVSPQGERAAPAGTVAAAAAASAPPAGERTVRLDLDAERDPNRQQRKLDFLKQRVDDRAIYNAHPLQHPVSPYEVMAGTVVAASLITGIQSDLPGLVIAQVSENVYDTVTGRFLLIPQGARLIGTYDSVVAFGQRRALVVWQRIIMPDGSSVVIDNLPATDTAGYAGLEDAVDFHTWQLIKGVVLSTLLGVGTELSLGQDESDLVRAIRESTQQNVNRAGQRLTERNLDIQPTLTIRPGWPLRVIVHKDLVLRPYQG